MDNRCGTDNSVVTGVCEQLHDGRIHPHFTCDRDRSGLGQDHSGAKNYKVVKRRGVAMKVRRMVAIVYLDPPVQVTEFL